MPSLDLGKLRAEAPVTMVKRGGRTLGCVRRRRVGGGGEDLLLHWGGEGGGPHRVTGLCPLNAG